MRPDYSYAIAAGWNVARASLSNLELIAQIARPPTNVLPVDPFPVRTEVLSNNFYGEGSLTHVWPFDSLPITGLNYLIATYLTVTGVVVVSAKVTIYTNNRDQGTYARYNAYLGYPIPQKDYQLSGKLATQLKLNFSGLKLLS